LKLRPLAGLAASAPLAERYRSQDPATLSLFGGRRLTDADSWTARASALDATAANRADRSRLVNALRSYNRRLPAHENVERSLDRLASPESLVVVGGQQAGLFGGALLILYKALTVVQTARFAEQMLGRPVVPVFWIAGEDHDYDEANHLHVVSREGKLHRIRLERPEGPRRSVSRTPLAPEQWEAALAELAGQLPETEFTGPLLERLRRHCEDAPSLSLAFARLVADWFGPDGLVLLDADDPQLRAVEGPFFRRLIERNDELEAALRQGEEAVRELGLPVQAESAPGGANLFLHHEQGRLLLFKQNGRFESRRGEASLSRSELLALADTDPQMLSNNALTRPLMQEYVLPVLAAVLGPSELAYWGTLGPAFALFGQTIPLLVPRQSFTYVEPTVAKWLDKYGVSPEDIMLRYEEKKRGWLAAQDAWRLEERFREVKDGFAALYGPLLETLGSLQSGLAKLGETNRDKIFEQIAYLENRATDAFAKQHEAGLRQWERMQTALWPLDRPQERVLSSIHFLNKYGPTWLENWSRVPFDVNGGHRLAEPPSEF